MPKLKEINPYVPRFARLLQELVFPVLQLCITGNGLQTLPYLRWALGWLASQALQTLLQRQHLSVNKPAKQTQQRHSHSCLQELSWKQKGGMTPKRQSRGIRDTWGHPWRYYLFIAHVTCQLRCAPTVQHYFPKTSSPPVFASYFWFETSLLKKS